MNKMKTEGDPEIVFFPQSLFRLRKRMDEIEQYTNKAQTVIVDGEMFSWYGAAFKSFDYFKMLHKNIGN
jgi:hypothetical protein